MTRRRILLAACVAVAAFGAAWWLFVDRLTAEEQTLVGTWQLREDGVKTTAPIFDLKPDRQLHVRNTPNNVNADGRWSIQGGKFCIERESNPIRRLMRPFSAKLGKYRIGPYGSYLLVSVSEREFTFIDENGAKYTYKRVRED